MRIRKRKRLGTIGTWIVGGTLASAIASKMPAGVSAAALENAGTSMAGFVSPMVNVAGAGIVMGALRKLPRMKKRRRR